jgi:hypothetical protein
VLTLSTPAPRRLGERSSLSARGPFSSLGPRLSSPLEKKEKGCQQRIREGAASGGEDEGKRWISVKRRERC